MADEAAGVNGGFKRPSTNSITSAEELDHYIKVTNPSAWVITLAALLLVGGIIVWAFVAVVPVTVETTGVSMQISESDDVEVVCWVDEATADRIGKAGLIASVNGVPAQNAWLADTPMSATEVVKYLGSDFYAESLDLKEWNYPIIIEPDRETGLSEFAIDTQMGEGHLVQVSIVTSETQPINIVLGKKK